MKSSIRLLAFTAAFLAVGFVETAHAQDRSNASPLRSRQAFFANATPPNAPGNLVADTSIVGGVAAAAVGGGLVIANNGGGTGGASVSPSRPTNSSQNWEGFSLRLLEATFWSKAADLESRTNNSAFAVGTGTTPETEANVDGDSRRASEER